MTGNTQSQINREFMVALSEVSTQQVRLLASLQEKVIHLAEEVHSVKSKLDKIETKLFIGNGSPAIISRIEKVEGDVHDAKESSTYLKTVVMPAVVSALIALLAALIPFAGALWK